MTGSLNFTDYGVKDTISQLVQQSKIIKMGNTMSPLTALLGVAGALSQKE